MASGQNRDDSMPSEIILQIGIKYMITRNINVDDGLFNGTCGILREIQLDPTGRYAELLWLDFMDTDIGLARREECVDTFKSNNAIDLRRIRKNLNLTWTYMTPIKCDIKQKGTTIKFEGYQYPLVPCEAMTIHKSQGATLQCVGMDLNEKGLKKSLKYVAYSRCTSINGLYFFGRPNFMDNEMRYMEQSKKDEIIQQGRESCQIRREMDRLRRRAQYEGVYPFLQMDKEIPFREKEYIDIIFQNTGNLNLRSFNRIRTENGFNSAEVMFFAETHTDPDHSEAAVFSPGYMPKNFKLHTLTGARNNRDERLSNGLVCLVRNEFSKELEFAASNAISCGIRRGYFNEKNMVEMSLHYFFLGMRNRVYLMNVYKHPGCEQKRFEKDFVDFLIDNINYDQERKRFTDTIYILGDFNINFGKSNPKKNELKIFLQHLLKEYGIKQVVREPTTERDTIIDWIFTNASSDNYEHFVYESFNYHKPLYLRIPK